MMKKMENLVKEIVKCPAVWVAESDADNLAKFADWVLESNIRVISVPNVFVDKVWPWVEKNKIKILNRYYFSNDIEKDISSFSADIMNGFRKGANGTQIFVGLEGLEKFVAGLKPIRDDLFFDKDFIIGVDVFDVATENWPRFFQLLKIIKPTGILLVANGDKFDASSDFVGRIYAMLGAWDSDAELQIMVGKNNLRIIQTIRLIQKKCPELQDKIIVYTTDLAV